MSNFETPDWTDSNNSSIESVHFANKIFYNPEELKRLGIGFLGRFFNRRYGISPFIEVVVEDDTAIPNFATDFDPEAFARAAHETMEFHRQHGKEIAEWRERAVDTLEATLEVDPEADLEEVFRAVGTPPVSFWGEPNRE